MVLVIQKQSRVMQRKVGSLSSSRSITQPVFMLLKSRLRVLGFCQILESKKISNGQELIQSNLISCPQNPKGNN